MKILKFFKIKIKIIAQRRNLIRLAIESSVINLKAPVHSSCIVGAGKLWRQKVGLPKLQSRLSFIDLPDYSFLGKFGNFFLQILFLT